MKKEKRSLFNMVFGKNQTKSVTKTRLEMFNGYNAEFTTLKNNTYDSKVARQCIDRSCRKLYPQ